MFSEISKEFIIAFFFFKIITESNLCTVIKAISHNLNTLVLLAPKLTKSSVNVFKSLIVVLVFSEEDHCQKVQIFDQCQETGAEE